MLLAEGLAEKDVVQLCCNNARDLLSVKNLGARRCVGFDLSDEFIAQGRDLAGAGGIDVELVAADVFDLPAGYEAGFDIVLVTPGSLSAFPDLARFFAIAASLLRTDGFLLVHEIHPMAYCFNREPSARSRWQRHSYFERESYEIHRGLDYLGGKSYAAESFRLYPHVLSDTVQAVLDAGFALERFEEHPQDVSGGRFKRAARRRAQVPLSYLVTARLGARPATFQ